MSKQEQIPEKRAQETRPVIKWLLLVIRKGYADSCLSDLHAPFRREDLMVA